MRRYRQPPPPSRSTGRMVGKVFGWIVLVVLVVGSGLAGGLYLYGHETLSAIGPHTQGSEEGAEGPRERAGTVEPATALVVGYDQRAGRRLQRQGLALGHADADPRRPAAEHALAALVPPRPRRPDLLQHDVGVRHRPNQLGVVEVRAAGHARHRPEAHRHSGQLPDHARLPRLQADRQQAPRRLHERRSPLHQHAGRTCSSCYATINLHPGYQKLDGQEALDFVRSRHTDNDLYRNARQQLFLEALKDRLASGFSLFEIPQLIGALKHNLEIARGGSTGTPSMSEIQSYVGLGYHLQPNHMFRVTINNLVDCGASTRSSARSRATSRRPSTASCIPTSRLPTRANAAALGRKPKAPKQPA